MLHSTLLFFTHSSSFFTCLTSLSHRSLLFTIFHITSVLIGGIATVTTTSLSPDVLVGHDGAHHDHPLEVLALGGRRGRRGRRRRRSPLQGSFKFGGFGFGF